MFYTRKAIQASDVGLRAGNRFCLTTAGSVGLALSLSGSPAASSSMSITVQAPTASWVATCAGGLAQYLVGNLDGILVFGSVPSAASLAGLGVRDLCLNPNATNTDWAGLASTYLVGLPAAVIRAIPLVSWYSSPSHPENGAAPPPLPFWVRLLTGDPHGPIWTQSLGR